MSAKSSCSRGCLWFLACLGWVVWCVVWGIRSGKDEDAFMMCIVGLVAGNLIILVISGVINTLRAGPKYWNSFSFRYKMGKLLAVLIFAAIIALFMALVGVK